MVQVCADHMIDRHLDAPSGLDLDLLRTISDDGAGRDRVPPELAFHRLGFEDGVTRLLRCALSDLLESAGSCGFFGARALAFSSPPAARVFSGASVISL